MKCRITLIHIVPCTQYCSMAALLFLYWERPIYWPSHVILSESVSQNTHAINSKDSPKHFYQNICPPFLHKYNWLQAIYVVQSPHAYPKSHLLVLKSDLVNYLLWAHCLLFVYLFGCWLWDITPNWQQWASLIYVIKF